ncbi:WD40 repeat-like protein, partial [Lindgomyces ingoldianus]
IQQAALQVCCSSLVFAPAMSVAKRKFTSHDCKTLVSASSDTTVKLWDANTGAVQQTLEGHLKAVMMVAFSPDSKVLASASHDKTVKLWDANTSAELQALEDYLKALIMVDFSPDGKVLASASLDTTITPTDDMVQTFQSSADPRVILFSNDGTFLETQQGIMRVPSFFPSEATYTPNLISEISLREEGLT